LGATDLSALEKMQGRLPLLGSEDWKFEGPPPNRKPRILFSGAPGSGKTTQALILAKKFSVPYISFQELLKNASRNDPDFSKDIQKKLEKKDPLSQALLSQLIRERLLQPDARDGFILDDFPADPAFIQIIEEVLSEFRQKLDAAVHLQVTAPILSHRYEKIISTLRNPESFEENYQREMREYEKNKQALLMFFQNRQNLIQITISNESADDQAGKLHVQNQITAAIQNLPDFRKTTSTETVKVSTASNLLEAAA
jgi:adenylate kinase